MQGRPPGLFRSYLSEQFHQFLLAPRDLFLRDRVGVGPCRGADVVEPAVEDIEFFTDFADALQPGRIIDTSVPYRFEILFEEIDQSAGLRAFHKLKGGTQIPPRQFQVNDVFVDLILVAAEGHPHFIEPDVAA